MKKLQLPVLWLHERWRDFREEWATIWMISKRICLIYEPFRFALAAIIVLSLLQTGCLLALPVFVKRLIEDLYRNVPVAHIMWSMTLIVLCFAALSPLTLLQDINRNRNLDIKNRWHLTNITLRQLLTFSLRQIASGNSGLRQMTIGKGEYAVHEVARTFIKELVPPLVRIVLTLYMFASYNSLMGVLVLPILLLYMSVSIGIDIYIFPKLKAGQDLDEKVDAEHSELLKHLELVVLSGEEDRALDEFNSRYDAYQQSEEALWVHYYKCSARLRDPIATLGFGLVIFATIYLILRGDSKPADIAMTSSWAVSLFTGLSLFAPMQRKFMRRYTLVRRYFQMLDQPPEAKSPTDAASTNRIQGRFDFAEVKYAHPVSEGNGSEVPAVCGVTLTIGRGETVGIVGHTGSGKSTLVKALLRWYDPDTGVILIDGKNLRELDLTWYRRQIGYVPQQVHLFDTTIRRNISFGCRRDLEDGELHELSKLIGFDRFYPRLGSKMFDVTVGELGRHLSGGQIQLIGIMRALAKGPAVLIFDEATASLDYGSEAIVQDAMRTALKGRTGIVIAHRLSTVRHLSRIFVMHEGRIVGVGTHQDLLSSCPEYANLVKHELRE